MKTVVAHEASIGYAISTISIAFTTIALYGACRKSVALGQLPLEVVM